MAVVVVAVFNECHHHRLVITMQESLFSPSSGNGKCDCDGVTRGPPNLKKRENFVGWWFLTKIRRMGECLFIGRHDVYKFPP